MSVVLNIFFVSPFFFLVVDGEVVHAVLFIAAPQSLSMCFPRWFP